MCWSKREDRWCAKINHSGKTRHLGFFADEGVAAAAYNRAAAALKGDKAILNPLPAPADTDEAGPSSPPAVVPPPAEQAVAECSICLGGLDDADAGPTASLSCCRSSVFHRACIEAWFAVNRTCPLCRAAPRRRARADKLQQR